MPWPLESSPEDIRRRLRWAARQGHPRYPWPDVPVADWRDALRRVETATRNVLAGNPAHLVAPDEATARALGVAAFTSGLGPLLGAWAEAGAIDTASPVREVLAAHLAHGRDRAAHMGKELRAAAAVLGAAGVRPLLIKAGHTAREYFPEAGTRPAADLDLVIPPDAWERTEGALARAGWTRAGTQLRPRKSEWVGPGSPTSLRSLELCHADDPRPVDLHDGLDRNFFGVRTVTVPDVRRAAADIPGPVDVLEQPSLLLLLALHASEGLHSLTLVRLVEIVLVVRRDRATGAHDDEAFRDLLGRTGAARFVHPALTLAERLAPGTFPASILDDVEAAATPAMRRIFGAMAPSDAQRPTRTSLAESFMWCAGPVDHLRRALHMLAPAPASGARALAALYRERLRRLVRGRVGVRR